ncbi:MAG: glycoside hydrolase family 5 protein [Ruminococcus sp.]|nr:glycoside hydrolase family 5 protein [Ruminococcus sp.]
MKKALYGIGLFMAAGMLLSGCAGGEENAGESEGVSDALESSQVIAEDAGQSGEESEMEDAGTQDIQAAEIESGQETDITSPDALAFVEDMKIGWCLGNTFDAIDYGGLSDELQYESCWCNAVTTKEMIDALKEAGFRTIRIPVSWHNHLTSDTDSSVYAANPEYVISKVWLDRVQEVVDYAIEDGLYVIINIHHDNSKEYIYPSSEYLEQSKTYVTDIWRQIAERFKDYDEHLIMEGMNEPRLVGTANEWWLDLRKEECIDAVECINELNLAFVDTVRSTGGQNAGRYLMVPGYAASLEGAVNPYFSLPEDIAGNQNRILVSVHAYTPYAFALQAPGEGGSTDSFDPQSASSTGDIDNLMDTLYDTFIKNGTGVVIGEFGARDKGGNTQARADFSAYYVEAARARGITCCVWDNNAFTGDGENFGLFRRTSLQFLYPEIVESLMSHCE